MSDERLEPDEVLVLIGLLGRMRRNALSGAASHPGTTGGRELESIAVAAALLRRVCLESLAAGHPAMVRA